MPEIFWNGGRYKLASAITATQTTIELESGEGIPPANISTKPHNQYRMVIEDKGGFEVVMVTAATMGGTTLTVVRGYEGTARAFAAGSVIGNRWTADHARLALGPDPTAVQNVDGQANRLSVSGLTFVSAGQLTLLDGMYIQLDQLVDNNRVNYNFGRVTVDPTNNELHIINDNVVAEYDVFIDLTATASFLFGTSNNQKLLGTLESGGEVSMPAGRYMMRVTRLAGSAITTIDFQGAQDWNALFNLPDFIAAGFSAQQARQAIDIADSDLPSQATSFASWTDFDAARVVKAGVYIIRNGNAVAGTDAWVQVFPRSATQALHVMYGHPLFVGISTREFTVLGGGTSHTATPPIQYVDVSSTQTLSSKTLTNARSSVRSITTAGTVVLTDNYTEVTQASAPSFNLNFNASISSLNAGMAAVVEVNAITEITIPVNNNIRWPRGFNMKLPIGVSLLSFRYSTGRGIWMASVLAGHWDN